MPAALMTTRIHGFSRGLFFSFLVLVFLFSSGRSIAQTSILMVFRDKPPYSFLVQDAPSGFLYERTRKIMEEAGITTRFEQMPPKRIFLEIEANTQPICSFGWYKIPQRERYASFSAPIHRDRPHVVLANRQSAPAIRRLGSLRKLFADGTLTLAVADGVSYGNELDRMISGFHGRVDKTLVAPLQLAKMVAAERADFMMIDQDDLDHLMQTQVGLADGSVTGIDFPDIPEGLERHILCSRLVAPATMARIDAAIRKIGPFQRVGTGR